MNTLDCDNLSVNLDIMTCFVDGKEVEMPKKEYSLLVYLMSNKNKVFSRGELSNAVWNKKFEGRTIDTTVSRLRKKLGTVGKHIKTKSGFGYGFIE